MTEDPPSDVRRSESPTGIPPSRILEWNFMASRINAIVAMLGAYKRLRIPPNMQNIADGMQIERAATALISGRLAIEGIPVGSQPMYNHMMAFRHSVDRGQRVLQKLVDEERLLPRWGSHSSTPAPAFANLKFYPQTNSQDWENFCGASGAGPEGLPWWTFSEPVDLRQYPTVKSADAALVWFRLLNQTYEEGTFIPQPTLAYELQYLLAWLNGVQRSLASSTESLDGAIDDVRARLHKAYLEDLAGNVEGTEFGPGTSTQSSTSAAGGARSPAHVSG